MRAKAFSCLADGGAFIFIDAIDPVGTLNRRVYERMGRVFAETRAYEPYLGGEMAQDVGVYLSTESKYDPADNGKAVDDAHLSGRVPHVEAVVSVCQALIENHIPFGVISKRNLARPGPPPGGDPAQRADAGRRRDRRAARAMCARAGRCMPAARPPWSPRTARATPISCWATCSACRTRARRPRALPTSPRRTRRRASSPAIRRATRWACPRRRRSCARCPGRASWATRCCPTPTRRTRTALRRSTATRPAWPRIIRRWC